MLHYRKLYGLGLAVLMLLALSSLVYAQAMTPSVTVSDQPITSDAVTVDKVVSSGPGWIAIHADNNGAPGPVLGYSAVKDGENDNVAVKLAAAGRTPTLYAMLHTDAGTVGTYEFPGPDVPVTVNGAVVTPAFKATNVTAAAAATTPTVAATEAMTSTEAMTPTVAATEAMTPTAATPTVAATVAATPTAAAPAALPTTGGDNTPWTSIVLLAVGGLVLIGGLSLALSSRKR